MMDNSRDIITYQGYVYLEYTGPWKYLGICIWRWIDPRINQMAELEVSEVTCYCNAGSIEDESPYLKCQVCEKRFHIGKNILDTY